MPEGEFSNEGPRLSKEDLEKIKGNQGEETEGKENPDEETGGNTGETKKATAGVHDRTTVEHPTAHEKEETEETNGHLVKFPEGNRPPEGEFDRED